MDIENRLKLSYYKTIAALNEEHNVYIVQNSNDKHIYVKKVLDVYNYEVYRHLHSYHINGTPFIYEIYQDESSLTVIEEYISGKTLEELLAENHVFTVEEIKNIICQLCDILSDLHHCRPAIIHRDIKPSNIILKEDGKIILLDLNAAKHLSHGKTEDTTLLGTKGYAAPEQYGFGTSNTKTDIYALGMVMNTLLNGEFSATPYKNSELTPIITKCLKLQPDERFKSVNEVKRQLGNHAPDNTDSSYEKRWFMPPGFRQLKPVNMLCASAAYAFTIWVGLHLEVENADPLLVWISRIFFIIAFIGVYFISADYMGIQGTFPLCRSNSLPTRIIGIVLLDILYLFAVVGIMLALLSLLA